MILEQRLEIILDILEKEKNVSNKVLTEKLNISESTLRRDLSLLQDMGKLTRVHGGAVLNIKSSESAYGENEAEHIDAKEKIAQKASKLIGDGKYIFLDGGSSCKKIIDHLDCDMGLTIVTNGFMHIEKLVEKGINTIFIEGQVKGSTMVTTGPKALRSLSFYSFDLAFIGANGYDDGGYYTADLSEALIKAKAIENSNRAYVLADSSKKNIRYFAKIADRNLAELIGEE